MAAVCRALYLNFSVAYELLYAGEVGVERLAYLVAEAVLVGVAVVCGEALDAGREDERGAEEQAAGEGDVQGVAELQVVVVDGDIRWYR